MKQAIGTFSVLLVLVCGCDRGDAQPAITPTQREYVLKDPLAAMAQARLDRDEALFFEAGKEIISNKTIYGITVKDLLESIGKASVRNWEASRYLFPTGRTAWLFHVGRANFFVSAWGENRRIKKATVYWMNADDDEVISRYPPEEKNRLEEEELANLMILLYYLTVPAENTILAPDKGREKEKAK